MNRLLFHFFIVSSISIIVSACNLNDGATSDELISEKPGQVISLVDSYQIVVPPYFEEMTDINPNAILQYGYISGQKDSSKLDFDDEIYVTVLTLPKNELASTFADTGRITLNKVNNRTAVNLQLILDDFKITEANPKPILINGFAAIKNEFRGRLGTYKVFYKMAIYESETEFYQLLTWCMQKHADKHSAEMEGMIQSFENV